MLNKYRNVSMCLLVTSTLARIDLEKSSLTVLRRETQSEKKLVVLGGRGSVTVVVTP